MNINIGGKQLLALVDSGASNNFIVERLVKDLGLIVGARNYRIRAVNLLA